MQTNEQNFLTVLNMKIHNRVSILPLKAKLQESYKRSQTSNETRKTSLSVNSSSIVFPLHFTGRFLRANLDDLNSPYSSFLINIVPRLLLFPPFLNKIQSEYLPSASSSLENISWHLTNKPLPPPQEHRNTFMATSRLTR